jgi:hypothetical protein
MSRNRILTVLCLALGAVSAETSAQQTVTLKVSSGPAISGGTLRCSAGWQQPLLARAEVRVFIGFDVGAGSPFLVGSQTIGLPFTTAVYTAATASTRSGYWTGSIAIPGDPSLIGRVPLAIAVALPETGAPLLSSLCPFGPIIEDSIN